MRDKTLEVVSMWRVFILAGTYFVIICEYITVDVVGSVWVYTSTTTYRLGICTCTLKGHESLMQITRQMYVITMYMYVMIVSHVYKRV